jgi:hypothetical protein
MAYSDNHFPLSARNQARNIGVFKIADGQSEKTRTAFPSSYLAVVPPQAGLFYSCVRRRYANQTDPVPLKHCSAQQVDAV